MRIFILLLIILNTQAQTKSISFNQKDFEKNKVFENTYHLWWNKYKWGPVVKDSIPYFVDDRNYKGVINYGVEYHSKDYRTFSFFENLTMFFLNIEIEHCEYNSKDSIIKIKGFVSGGWGDLAKNGQYEPKNYIEIFVGEKTDTISNCYYNAPVNDENIDVILKNKKIKKHHILDSFPSFYFKNPKYFRTSPKGKRPFKIEVKVEKNTVIVFGASSCYTEIFDIGSMIYSPNKNRNKKIKKKDTKKSVNIIVNNILIADQENEKLKPREINYYTYTEKAENQILRKQYTFAKETYVDLSKKYNMYARDIHNAIRCAILSRDYNNAYYWAEELAKKGVPFIYFNSNAFKLLKKHKQWDSFSKKYDSIYNEFQSKRDVEFKEEIERLLQEDQADYGLANRKEPKVLFKTTERVTNKLIDLLNKKGYPSEEKIGVYLINDTILNNSPAYNVIIRHAFQQNPTRQNELMNLLDEADVQLEYDKKRSSNHRGFLNSCFHIYKGNLYCYKSCGRNELMIKKMKYMFNNPYNFILDYGDFIVAEYNEANNDEDDKFYNEQFNFIMKLTDDWNFPENN